MNGTQITNALVWLGPRQMEWQQVAAAALTPGQVRIEVQAVGICGSELSGYLGHNSLRVPPLVMGHEFSGVVQEVGAGAEAAAGDVLSVGDRVVVNPLLTCGECDFCLSGHDNLCEQRALIGAHLPGAFADSVVVPAAACLPLADSVDFLSGSLAEPLACAVRAVSLAAGGDALGGSASASPGGSGRGKSRGSLRVIGAGPIGLLCALVAKRSGFDEVSIYDPNEVRMALAARWGIAGSSQDASPANAAIDAVGLEATRKSAIAAVRRGGTAVFIGLHSPQAVFDGNDLARDEKVVRGCFAYTKSNFASAVALLEEELVPAVDEWVVVRDLSAGRASFEELTGPDPASVKIVLRPDGADWRLDA